MLSQIELLTEHSGAMRVYRFKNVVICDWQGQATGPAVRTLTTCVRELLARNTHLYSFVHTVLNRVTLPDGSARTGMIELMKTYSARTACAAIVIGGNGFWASAMRSAVTGLRVLGPRSFDYRLHGSTSEVLDWLPDVHRARTNVEITRLELEQFFASVAAW